MQQTSNKVTISDIKVGNRFRKDLGDIDSLAKSIQEIHLLHPVVINENNELIAGHRRIEAAKKLGWAQIPCTVINISDLIKGELQENVVRKDFTFSERQAILEDIESKRLGHRQKKDTNLVSFQEENKDRRSIDIVSNYTGVSTGQLQKEKKIVQAVKENPEEFEGIIEEIDRGEVSVNKASKHIDNHLEFKRQQKEEAKAKEEEDKRRAELSRKVQTACIKGCGKMVTTMEYNREHAVCEECNLKEQNAKYEEFRQWSKHRSEVNPLIRYCHLINNIAEGWEIPFGLDKKLRDKKFNRDKDKDKDKDFVESATEEWRKKEKEKYAGPLDKFSDDKFTSRSYKKLIPYDPSSGISQEEWWKRVERKRQELKQQDIQRKADNELSFNSPTKQVLDKLSVVSYEGCRCKAELMRQGQFCPVCRLMVKVHDYAERLFKDTAEGRGIGGDMSITR